MKHAWCIYFGGGVIVWKSVPVLDNVSVNFNSTLSLFWTLPGRKETWSKDTLPSRKRWKCTPNTSKRWKRKAPLNCSERLVNRLIKFINSVCLQHSKDVSYDDSIMDFNADAPNGIAMEGYLYKRASNAFKTWSRWAGPCRGSKVNKRQGSKHQQRF